MMDDTAGRLLPPAAEGQDELLGSARLGNPRASERWVRLPMDGQSDTEAVRRDSQEVFGRAS